MKEQYHINIDHIDIEGLKQYHILVLIFEESKWTAGEVREWIKKHDYEASLHPTIYLSDIKSLNFWLKTYMKIKIRLSSFLPKILIEEQPYKRYFLVPANYPLPSKRIYHMDIRSTSMKNWIEVLLQIK